MKKKPVQMDVDIFRFVYQYSLKNKLADENFIKEILKIIIREEKLEKKIQEIRIKEESPYKGKESINDMAYNYKNKYIVAYLKDLEQRLDILKKKSPFSTSFETTFYINLEIVRTLLHETRHAKQDKMITENNQDIETKLLTVNRAYKDLLNSLAIDMYPNTPQERMANIDASLIVERMILPFKPSLPRIVTYEQATTISKLNQGYHLQKYEIICPTFQFLYSLGETSIMHSFDFYDKNYPKMLENINQNYTKKEQFRLGLPVSYDEYNKMQKKLFKTLNKIK